MSALPRQIHSSASPAILWPITDIPVPTLQAVPTKKTGAAARRDEPKTRRAWPNEFPVMDSVMFWNIVDDLLVSERRSPRTIASVAMVDYAMLEGCVARDPRRKESKTAFSLVLRLMQTLGAQLWIQSWGAAIPAGPVTSESQLLHICLESVRARDAEGRAKYLTHWRALEQAANTAWPRGLPLEDLANALNLLEVCLVVRIPARKR